MAASPASPLLKTSFAAPIGHLRMAVHEVRLDHRALIGCPRKRVKPSQGDVREFVRLCRFSGWANAVSWDNAACP